jgi:YHS domain-containing protein
VPERLGGTLVRDPHCGTYILESTALQVRAGHETLHFCSAACRDAYRQRA